ncbi:MAG: nucleotidyltransferase domain-containing protein [Alphaproteobacteria bacterium]|nr:nucleotidyltransferase domain-containing protein [Alphaproteobacteria bacterium]
MPGAGDLAGTGGSTALHRLLARRTAERRAVALPLALRALDALAARGYEGRLTGSLARGTFLDHSDVDIIVLDGPRGATEPLAIVEEAFAGAGIPVDVVLAADLAPADRQRMLEGSLDAPAVRALAERG